MADTKITALTAVSGAARSMLIPVVEDPSGTPVTKKMTVDQLLRLDSGTHASSSPLIDMAQTWNASGTTFTGVKFNIAATAAAADSLLFDFQVGGTSKFKIRHDGLVTATSIAVGDGVVGTPSIYFASETNTGFYRNSTSQISVTLNGAARAKFLATSGGGAIDLLGGGSSEYFLSVGTIGSGDLKFVREAAGSFAQRNGTNAQAFRIYNTYTDASNYERFFLGWSANTFYVQTENAGTGSERPLVFSCSRVDFRTNGTYNWSITSSGHLIATDNTFDIGASGANRPRTGYFGTNVIAGGSFTSGAPSGGTAAAWKLGSLVTAAVTPDTTRYIELDVAGTLYKVIVST